MSGILKQNLKVATYAAAMWGSKNTANIETIKCWHWKLETNFALAQDPGKQLHMQYVCIYIYTSQYIYIYIYIYIHIIYIYIHIYLYTYIYIYAYVYIIYYNCLYRFQYCQFEFDHLVTQILWEFCQGTGELVGTGAMSNTFSS